MTESKANERLTGTALVAAVVVLTAWLVLLCWLAFHTAASELQWARLGSVLASLEAVAFAAAGALFGTTVQKRRVEDAKEQAQKAEDRASQAEKISTEHMQGAANGRALATAVTTRARMLAGTEGSERRNATGPSAETIDDLAALATELFPN